MDTPPPLKNPINVLFFHPNLEPNIPQLAQLVNLNTYTNKPRIPSILSVPFQGLVKKNTTFPTLTSCKMRNWCAQHTTFSPWHGQFLLVMSHPGRRWAGEVTKAPSFLSFALTHGKHHANSAFSDA